MPAALDFALEHGREVAGELPQILLLAVVDACFSTLQIFCQNCRLALRTRSIVKFFLGCVLLLKKLRLALGTSFRPPLPPPSLSLGSANRLPSTIRVSISDVEERRTLLCVCFIISCS